MYNHTYRHTPNNCSIIINKMFSLCDDTVLFSLVSSTCRYHESECTQVKLQPFEIRQHMCRPEVMRMQHNLVVLDSLALGGYCRHKGKNVCFVYNFTLGNIFLNQGEQKN